MSHYSFTAKDMLLNNLSEHRVIRIDGSDRWMDQLIREIVAQTPDTLLLETELAPADLEAQLSGFLGVGQGREQIRQALENKSLLNKRLVVIVSSETVNADSLCYLMELTEIGDFNRNAVTLVLRTSRELVELLTSSPPLAGRLDGYYEEEKTAVSARYSLNPLLIGTAAAVALLAGAVGYFALSGAATTQPQVQNPAQVVTQEQTVTPVVVSSESEPESKSVSAAVNSRAVQNAIEPETSQQQPVAQPEATDAATQKMVAELAQVLEKHSPKVKTAARLPAPPSVQAVSSAPSTPSTPSSPSAPVLAQENSGALAEMTEPTRPNSQTTVSEKTSTAEPAIMASAKTAVASVAHLNNATAVKQAVTEWQDAWQKQDWPRYINSYIQERPHGVTMSLEEWREFRKQRLLSPAWIKLEFGEIRLTRLNSHWFRAEFYQRFEKPNYADETTKRLELMLTAEGWKIASENPIGTVVLKRTAN